MLAALLLVMMLAACGGGTEETTETSSAPAGDAEAPAAASADDGKGVGPIDHVDVAALDMGRSAEGAEIFNVKCTACHKIEERYIGPALSGVTKRRKPEWIMNMILNPDVMVQEDEAAKALFMEYIAPMTNQNLTQEEAEAVLVYFMSNDAALDGAGEGAGGGQ
jgi:mono/diheme cytochrome c family protein